MANDDDGLAGALYQLANDAEQLSRRLRAQSVVLRHAHERAVDRTTQSVVLHCQPLSLESATAHEPKCDVCKQAKSQCMGVHDTESRWPSC